MASVLGLQGVTCLRSEIQVDRLGQQKGKDKRGEDNSKERDAQACPLQAVARLAAVGSGEPVLHFLSPFDRTQDGALRPRILFALLLARNDWFPGQQLIIQLYFVCGWGKILVLGLPLCLFAEEILHDLVFRVVEGDDDQPSARIEECEGFPQGLFQFLPLVVDGIAEGQEILLGRMSLAVLLPAGENVFEEIDELQCRLELTGRTLSHDFPCDKSGRGALTIALEDALEFLLGRIHQDVLRRLSLALVHPHIERSVVAIGETSFRIVELRGGDADVHQDEVGLVDAKSLDGIEALGVLDLKEVLLDSGEALQSLLRLLDSLLVAVDSDEDTSLIQLRQDLGSMSRSSQGQVEIHDLPVGNEGTNFIEKNGRVRPWTHDFAP